MKPNGWRPDAAAWLNFSEAWVRQMFDSVIEDGPIDQIFGMENRQSRRAIETRRRQVKIAVYSHYVRV